MAARRRREKRRDRPGADGSRHEIYRDGKARIGQDGLLERAEALDPMARMQAAEALEQSEDPALLLSTLRSLLRDVAAHHGISREELLQLLFGA